MFSGIVLAGGEGKERIKEVFKSDNLKVDLSDDLIGLQVASSLKNILAVLIGVLDGAGLGDNAMAYVITKGLDEIAQVGVAFGAKKETFYGLAGMGDVIVTCSSEHSRNRSVGKQIGSGINLKEVLSEMKMIAEGVTTSENVPLIKERFNLEIPLLTGTYEILFEGKKLKKVLEGL
jgi:glycerol-3-phosphate dehydrogenase (NAD(P)+)